MIAVQFPAQQGEQIVGEAKEVRLDVGRNGVKSLFATFGVADWGAPASGSLVSPGRRGAKNVVRLLYIAT